MANRSWEWSITVTPDTHIRRKGIGMGTTLPKDYATLDDLTVILKEYWEEIARRVRVNGYMGLTVSLGIWGGYYIGAASFHKQVALEDYTNDGLEIYQAAECLVLR